MMLTPTFDFGQLHLHPTETVSICKGEGVSRRTRLGDVKKTQDCFPTPSPFLQAINKLQRLGF